MLLPIPDRPKILVMAVTPFAPKSLAKFTLCIRGVASERNGLDCDYAVNLGISGAVNHSHGAPANFIEDLVTTEATVG